MTILGRSCAGADVASLRRTYRAVIANYRLLDCEGRAISWKDDKIYSAAAIGMDREGWVVLAHARAPHRMDELARLLAAPELRLVAAGGVTVDGMGSYETGFREDDTNAAYWEIRNVIGFAAAAAPPRARPSRAHTSSSSTSTTEKPTRSTTRPSRSRRSHGEEGGRHELARARGTERRQDHGNGTLREALSVPPYFRQRK